MIHFTGNVRFSEAQAMAWLIRVAESVYDRYGYEMWTTSAEDGKHSPTSLHQYGLALDLRTKQVDKQTTKDAIFTDLKALLSPTFEVFFEDIGGPNEHIHAEYDPNHNNKPA